MIGVDALTRHLASPSSSVFSGAHSAPIFTALSSPRLRSALVMSTWQPTMIAAPSGADLS